MTFEDMLGCTLASFLFRLAGIIILLAEGGLWLLILGTIVYALGPIIMWYGIIQYSINREESECPTKTM